ncbi:hypothetical protein C1X05_14180 [Laceyella sacchari]|nr:hypothetical protein C1X05_14180 [Laceyella sacchari]
MAHAKRIKTLDILRGLAILGTLGTNIWLFAYLGDLNYLLTFTHNEWWSSADAFWRTLMLALVNGKLLGLLAIMFGIGLELKYRQAQRLGRPWPGMYIWISLILLLEGFLHFTLVMEYDILMSYAVTAMLVSFIVKGGEKVMRIAMIVFAVIHVFFIGFVSLGVLAHQVTADTMATPQAVITLYQSGTWWEQVQYRLSDFWLLRLEALYAIPYNTLLFLIGVKLMRKGAFQDDVNGRNLRKKLMKIGLLVGLPLNLLWFVPGGYFDFPVRYLFAPILSLGYMGLIGWLVDKFRSLSLWGFLENAGKMSLSCYVLQNIVCSILFYGWGIGLGGNLNSLTVIAIWIGVCLFQLLFAHLWLRRFPMGPMETARKALTGLLEKGKRTEKSLRA